MLSNNSNLSNPVFIVVFFSILTRVVYHFLGFEDYWGDAYHSLMISEFTIENGWIYDDYKGREVVWLPVYRYLSTLFISLFNRYDLLVPHILNMALGSVSCCLVYFIIKEETHNQKAAVIGGLVLSFLPWHVAFSHMNMSEGLCGLVIAASVYSIQKELILPLTLLVFFGVLIRNEMSYLYLIILGGLLAKRKLKLSSVIFFTAILSLGIWAFWCWYKTGDPFWWITTRVYGSTRDASLSEGPDGRPIWIIFASLLQAFPLAIVLFSKKNPKTKNLGLLKLLVYGHWFLLFLMQFKFFSTPDAHYFIITLPVASALYGVLWHNNKKRLNAGLIISVISFFILLPTFYFLQFTNFKAKEIGQYIKTNDLNHEIFLNDFPVAYYHGEIDIHNNFSTDQALNFKRNSIDEQDVLTFIEKKNIKYVIGQDVSFSNTHRIWPMMRERKNFQWNNIDFRPVYTSNGVFKENNLIDKLKNYAGSNRGEVTLWVITPKLVNL